MYISPMRMVLAVLGVLLVMFAVVVTAVVYTPILDTLPGYPGKKPGKYSSPTSSG